MKVLHPMATVSLVVVLALAWVHTTSLPPHTDLPSPLTWRGVGANTTLTVVWGVAREV